MLFELATALPELLTAASRAAVKASTLSQSETKAQLQKAGDNHVREQGHSVMQQAKQRQRHTQQHQVVDVARESAMLQVCRQQNPSPNRKYTLPF